MAPAPVHPAERIDAIDVLRGVALLGVLAVNLVTGFRVSMFQQFLPLPSSTSALDRAVLVFLTLAVELKALALFSFLFGVGLAIQFERLTGKPNRLILLVRRLAVLLLVGLAHLFLIWNGDILTAYAVAGFIVLPFLWGSRWLAGAGALLFLAVYLILPTLHLVPWPTAAWIANHVAEATHVYGTDGFSDMLAFRIGEVFVLVPLQALIFPRLIALVLLGVFVWRSQVLRRPTEHQVTLLALAMAGLLIGGTLTLVTDGRALLGWPPLGLAHQPLELAGGILLAAGYGAAILGFAGTRGGKTMLSWAAPLGRMAFTNYLAQSVIFSLIFYGYGLGLFGRLDAAPTLALGIGLFVAQALVSRWWLRNYRFGPVEWLWRTLMYGQPQPFRLPVTPSPAG